MKKYKKNLRKIILILTKSPIFLTTLADRRILGIIFSDINLPKYP